MNEFYATADDDQASKLSTDGRSDGSRSRSRSRSRPRNRTNKASHKKRKAYLYPESTASVPKATNWRLLSSASGSCTSRPSRRTSVSGPSASSSPQLLISNSDNESQSLWPCTDTDHDAFELMGNTDDDYGDCASEDSERVASSCGTSFSDYEDMFDKPCDSFDVEDLALPFIEGGRLTREKMHL
ncbi:hypothetical protein MRX96_007764 [Rhipicephalus microplus]